jgi:hypothetical protein
MNPTTNVYTNKAYHLFPFTDEKLIVKLPDYEHGRGGHAIVRYLANDRLYMFGGFDNRDIASVERFDGVKWTSLADLPQALTKLGVSERNGMFYISGWA